MEMQFFSVVEMPIKHSSLHNTVKWFSTCEYFKDLHTNEHNNDCLPDYFQDKPENSCLSWQKGNKDLKKKS